MLKTFITCLFPFIAIISIEGQQVTKRVFTSDIDNFWATFDSCQNTKDSLRQVEYFQKNYISKGTKGLKAFMLARGYSAELWVKLVQDRL